MAQPRIVIVGGGFGGLAAAKALRNAPAEIILIDRTNHHLFQPLLYQVARSVLSPNQIGFPIRGILQSQKNTTVLQGEVTGVDKDKKCVFVSDADRQDVPGAALWTNTVDEVGTVGRRDVPAVVSEMNRTMERAIGKLLTPPPAPSAIKGN